MKPDGKRLWKTKRRIITAVAVVAVVVAAGLGIWYYTARHNEEPVYVYPFSYVGMTEYWGDSQESYGPVTTDKIQTVFLTDTQSVTEILVQEGDMVQKGQLMLSFDTTLSDLQLERKRLDVEKQKLQLENARKKLREINSMKPMVIPEISENSEEEDTNRGRLINQERLYEISTNSDYDGSMKSKALICWIHGEKNLDDAVFRAIQDTARAYQEKNFVIPEATVPPSEEATAPPSGEATTPPSEETTTPSSETVMEPPVVDASEATEQPQLQSARFSGMELVASASELIQPDVSSFYVVIKVTSGNMSLGDKVVWQGMKVTDTGNGFVFHFVDAGIPDHMLIAMGSQDAAEETPEIDLGSGYTAAQIAQMRSDKQKEIKDLEFKIKMTEAEYKIMQKEVSDGNVYAEVDGQVVSVLSEEEARQSAQPLLKVSGGGGFYVEGSISELEKDSMKPGQEVTVNDWNSGMTYTGTVESIGDFPNTSGYYGGMGNPNASYYPFRVFVDGSADLQSGNYVSMTWSFAEGEHGVYLQNPFLRTENGKRYVYVLGENGKLEQRYVTTGKALWGSYTEILEGLTEEDLVAFPYGKNVKPGATVQEGDMSNLYG